MRLRTLARPATPENVAAVALLYYYDNQAVNDLTAELKGRFKAQ